MDPPDEQGVTAVTGDIRICGSRLVLRALRPDEIDAEWRAMVAADPMAIAELPDEASFRARLQRSGQLDDGWLDLAIDVGGVSVGRIQTFVPPGRPLPLRGGPFCRPVADTPAGTRRAPSATRSRTARARLMNQVRDLTGVGDRAIVDGHIIR